MKKRILSAAMALLMLLSLMPQVPAFAAGAISVYETAPMPTFNLMNGEMAESAQFVKDELIEGAFNDIDLLGLKKSMDEAVKFSWNKTYDESSLNDSTFWELYKKGDISVRFGGNFRGDKHGSVKNHPFSYKYSYQQMTLGGTTIKGPDNDDRRMQYNDTDSLFVPLGGDSFRLKISHGGCSKCGSPKFSDPVAMFADTVAPKITGWYMTAEDSMGKTAPTARDNYTQGDMYIHFTFSEPVRFADHSANHDDVVLGLKLTDRDTNQAVQEQFYAELVALRDNVVTFKFTVPKNIPTSSSNPPNHYISGFTGITVGKGNNATNALYKKNAFKNNFILDGKGIFDYSVGDMLKTNIFGAFVKSELDKDGSELGWVNSLFTDLAGNSLATTSITNLVNVKSYAPLADLKAPYIESVNLDAYDGNTLLTGVVENGQTVSQFVKNGHKLKFTVVTSEHMSGGKEDLKIQVNIKDASGEYIWLTPTNRQNHVINNNPPDKHLYSYELTLTEDMTPAEDGSIAVLDVTRLSDLYENTLDERPMDGSAGQGKLVPAISKDIFLDLLAPKVTLDAEEEADGSYATDRAGEDTVTVAFDIQDDTGHGNSNASGVITVGDKDVYGSFMLTPQDESATYDTKDFQYAITAGVTDPDAYYDAELGKEISFLQYSGAHKLYLKFPGTMDVNLLPFKLTLTASDFSGHTATEEFLLQEDNLLEVVDRAGPVISFTDSGSEYDDALGTGTIHASFTVSDKGLVNVGSIEYAFVEKDTEPMESDWASAMAEGSNAETITVESVSKTGLDISDTSEFDLYVRAEDATGSRNATVSEPYRVLYGGTYPKYSISTNEKTYARFQKLAVKAELSADASIPAPVVYVLSRPRSNAKAFFGDDCTFFDNENAYILSRYEYDTSRDSVDFGIASYSPIHGIWDEEANTFTPVDTSAWSEGYEDVMTGYWGVVDHKVLIGYGLTRNEGTGAFECDYPVAEHDYELWASDADSKSGVVPFSVDARWVSPEEEIRGAADWNPADGGRGSLKTLAGQMIDVTVTQLCEPLYSGVGPLDTANSYVRVVDEDGTVLYEQNITQANMRIVLPDNLPYTNDKKRVHIETEIRVTSSYDNSWTDKFDALDVYVFPGEVSEFGVGKLVQESSTNVVLPVARITEDYMGYDPLAPDMNLDYSPPGRIVLNSFVDEAAGGLHFTHTFRFTTRSQDAIYNEGDYVLVQNETDGVSHEGTWQRMPTQSYLDYKVVVYESAEALNGASHGESEIPVVANSDNLITYRVMHDNGGESPIYSMTLMPDATMDPIDIGITPENPDGIVNHVEGVVRELPVGAKLYHSPVNSASWNEITGDSFELTSMNEQMFDETLCVVDLEGNMQFVYLGVPEYLWTKKPFIEEYLNSPNLDWNNNVIGSGDEPKNVTRIDMTVNQDADTKTDMLTNGFKLHVAFNEEYGNRIGVSSITYDLPPQSEWNGNGYSGGHRFLADDTNRHTGIFGFDLNEYAPIAISHMMFQHKYDDTKAEGATEEVTLTFTVEDMAGNVSEPYPVTRTMKNVKPEALGITMKDMVRIESLAGGYTMRMPSLMATVPILDAYPSSYTTSGNAGKEFLSTALGDGTWSKDFINIYRDGYYEVTFVDMFGEHYRGSFNQEPLTYSQGEGSLEYNIGMDIQFSDPDPETGEVVMTYKSLDERVYVDIAQGTLPSSIWPGQSSATHTILAATVNEAEVTLKPDSPVLILLLDPDKLAGTPKTYDYIDQNVCMVIPEFVKTSPQAEVEWYFDEFKSSTITQQVDEDGNLYTPTSTSQNVTAYLKTDRYVNPVNGKGTYHTFTYGDETGYTFEFEDLSGVYGSLTVELPITLTAPVPKTEDTTSPDYTLEIYGKYNAVYMPEGSYAPGDDGTPTDAISAIDYWVRGYMLSFQVTDESPVKLVVTEPGGGQNLTYQTAKSDTLDGVSARGTQVVIDEVQDFDVLLIDAGNNITRISILGEDFKLDLEPPYIVEELPMQTDLYETTVYIKLADNHSEAKDIRWIYPVDAAKVADGQYALVFDGNKTINIRFADALGNEGSADIEVDDMDTSKPRVIKETWTPGDNGDSSVPPRTMLNTDVVALVEFSTQIKELTITDKNGGDISPVSALLQNNQAVITFEDSNFLYDDETYELIDTLFWELELHFTGVNGVSGTYSLAPLGPVIDKNPPWSYTMFDDDEMEKVPYVDIVFEGPTEDCYMQDTGNKLYKAGEPITRRITENGDYVFTFIDAAGNMSSVDVKVTCIDAEPPLVLLADLPEKDFSTNGSVTFKATLNEAGTITINGETKNIAAPVDADGNGKFSEDECNWAEFTISENGGYKILASDSIGLVTESYISITCIDRSGPGISFAPSLFTLMQGTQKSIVDPLLTEGITVWDNVSDAEAIEVAVEAFDEALLNQVGVHPITYTVTDTAGNTTFGTRYLNIFSASEPQILLNDTKTFKDNVTILKDENINLSVSNLPEGDGEPYTVYLRMGRWKEGQMKTNAEKLEGSAFTAEKNKYYTLYVVTQSRGTYLTYFIVQ